MAKEPSVELRIHDATTDEARPAGNNLVQVGIGGWQAPRPSVKVGRERGASIMTVIDCVEMGIDEAAKRALEVAWAGPTPSGSASTSTA